MATTATTAASNPLQPTYLSTPATETAATVTNTYNPNTATSELNNAAQVQDQGQNQQLMQMLAAQGISPGSSAAQSAEQNLAGSQTAALAPSLVSAQQYGAGLDSTTNLANQSATNQATGQNLQDLLQSQQYNATAANTAGQNSAAMQNNDYEQQLADMFGLQQQGLSTSGSLAGQQANQNVVMQPSFLQSLSSGLTGAAQTAAPFSQASPATPSGGNTGNFVSSNGYGY